MNYSNYTSVVCPNISNQIYSVNGVRSNAPMQITNTLINPNCVQLPNGFDQANPQNFVSTIINDHTITKLVNHFCNINNVGCLTSTPSLNNLTPEQIGGILNNQFMNQTNTTCCFVQTVNNIPHTYLYCSGSSTGGPQLIDCVGINKPSLDMINVYSTNHMSYDA